MLIDSHCHLDQYPAPDVLAVECVSAGLAVVAVTNLPAHYAMATTHLAGKRSLYPALGLHPLAVAANPGAMQAFRRLASHADFIGEIGLDFSAAGRATRRAQETAFESILGSLSDRPRFISLHSRGAESEVLDALGRFRIQRAVFHWYSGPVSMVEAIAGAGHLFSLNPKMIGADKTSALLRIVPRTQILAETDGPHVRVGSEPLAPSGVKLVYEFLARQWECTTAEVDRQIEANFRHVAAAHRGEHVADGKAL